MWSAHTLRCAIDTAEAIARRPTTREGAGRGARASNIAPATTRGQCCVCDSRGAPARPLYAIVLLRMRDTARLLSTSTGGARWLRQEIEEEERTETDQSQEITQLHCAGGGAASAAPFSKALRI